MEFSVFDIVGTIGVAAIVITYFLLQLGKVRSDSLIYSVVNGIGACLIIISLWFDFNFSAFIIEFFWLLISLYGIAKYLLNRS